MVIGTMTRLDDDYIGKIRMSKVDRVYLKKEELKGSEIATIVYKRFSFLPGPPWPPPVTQ